VDLRAFPLGPDRRLQIEVMVPESDLLGGLAHLRLGERHHALDERPGGEVLARAGLLLVGVLLEEALVEVAEVPRDLLGARQLGGGHAPESSCSSSTRVTGARQANRSQT